MISYADVTLRMSTPEFQACLDSVRFLDDLSAFVEPPELANRTLDGVPDWGPPPKPRLNTLWWPTGATRWAQGWFLATDDELQEIVGKMSAASWESQILELSSHLTEDRDETKFRGSMFLLPPRRVTVETQQQHTTSIWLLPLVDERYWWQYRLTPEDWKLKDGEDSWKTLIEKLAGVLNPAHGPQLLEEEIPAAYLYPDLKTFNRPNFPAAVLLDAAAASVGRRVVRRLNGNLSLMSWSESAKIFEENYQEIVLGGEFTDLIKTVEGVGELGADVEDLLAELNELERQNLGPIRYGGQSRQYNAAFPRDVTTRFRCDQQGEPHVLPILAEHVVGERNTVEDTSKIVRTTYHPVGTDDPDGEEAALAVEIATDYYMWRIACYRYVFSGIQKWQLSGYDDALIWYHGHDDVTTTVQTWPYNQEVNEQYQQRQYGNIPDEGLAELTEDLEAGGMATANLMEWDAEAEEGEGGYVTSTVEITIHSVGGMVGYEGLRVRFKRNPDNCRLEMACCNRQLFLVRADSEVAAGGSGTFSVVDYDDLSDTDLNITANSRFFAFEAAQTGWAELNPMGEFEATPGGCPT